MSNPAQGAEGAETMTAKPGDLLYRSEWETKRTVTHEEAREIAARLIASHFRRTDCETARAGIPARPDYDDDLLINAYIKQQARKDAAPASPRADSDAILKAACKPWEHYTGEPPDDGSPLSGVFVAGMVYTERLLAKLLDVTHYEGGDGSEDFDADATQTLRNILTGARLWDADENRPVSVTPAQPAGAVPDSLRALSEAAGRGKFKVVRGLHDYAVVAEARGKNGLLNSADADFAAASANFVRALLASHPAGQSAGSGAEDAEFEAARAAGSILPLEWTLKRLEMVRQSGETNRNIWLRNTAWNAIQWLGRLPDPDSTRTGQVGVPDIVRSAVANAAAADGFANGPAAKHYAALRALEWVETLLAARPAAPEAQGVWVRTNKSMLNLSGGGSHEWFRASDGTLQSFPHGFDPNVGRYDGAVISPAPPASSGQGV